MEFEPSMRRAHRHWRHHVRHGLDLAICTGHSPWNPCSPYFTGGHLSRSLAVERQQSPLAAFGARALQAQSPVAWAPGSDTEDDGLHKVPGKHWLVFDSTNSTLRALSRSASQRPTARPRSPHRTGQDQESELFAGERLRGTVWSPMRATPATTA